MPELERFEGTYRHGKKDGTGYYCYPDGCRYSGDWENGLKHGYGFNTYANGYQDHCE